MRICLISYDFYPHVGGQGVEAYNLFRRLREEQGLEVKVVSGCRNDIEGHVCIKVTEKIPGSALRFSFKVNQRLKRILTRISPDLVQIYGGPGGVLLLRETGLPVVYVANHTYAQQRRYLGRRVYGVLARAENVGYARSSHIVAISTTTRKSLIEDYGIKGEKVTVIPVGVDTSRFKPLVEEKIPDSMLFVGRLCERKGLFHLLEACSLIRRKKPDFHLFIAGEGGLLVSLKAKAADLGLSGNVSFLGKISEEELVRWYNRVEVFCLPSLFEGFGIVCLEAMACGTPVLASRSPGIVDVMPAEHGGLMFEPGNARELAAKAIALLGDQVERRTIGESLRRTAEREYDWKSISLRFLDIYRKVMDA